MNITANAASLSWKTNNHGVWKALVKNMTPDSAVTFSAGYTATVSGRQVTISNSTYPTGSVTYTTDLTNTAAGGMLYGAGTAYDSLEAISGEKTVRIGSVDLGTLEWTEGTGVWTATLADVKPGTTGLVSDNGYTMSVSGTTLTVTSTTSPTGTLYYELATPVESTETAQPLTLTSGDNTFGGGSFNATYEGTDYSIPLGNNCKYIHRLPDGTEELITGSTTVTSVNVTGAQDKLIDLTRWFGKGKEPSINDFYKLYPTWKGYDIPYDSGTILNYKGTGIQTIGFNAYDNSTGTAVLLGGNEYQICGTYTSCSYVDQWGNAETLEIDANGIFTPVNNGTLTVVGGNNTDTCVHLTWSGYKNFGEPEYQYEGYVKNDKSFPIATYFPEGMNGIGDVFDELTSDGYVKRFGVVDLSTFTWVHDNQYVFGYWKTNISGIIKIPSSNTELANIAWENGITKAGNAVTGTVGNVGTIGINTNSQLLVNNGSTTEAPTGYLVYELATPVVTSIAEPLNLSYPVNDFGTEQSLPVNTTTIVTTGLNADIKYSQDFTRLLVHYSDMYPTVKTLVEDEPNLMRKDEVAPNATVGSAYNLIDRNAAGTERQFSFDTAGGTQDITDGTAIAKKVMGTTLNLNQLVHDTNENSVNSVNGAAEVTDAVAANAKSLAMYGDSYVRNQLVPDTAQPETKSSTGGSIQVQDAVAGDALALRMVAPRSVVVNQLATSNEKTFTLTGNGSQNYAQKSLTFAPIINHVYIVKTKITSVVSESSIVLYFRNGTTAGIKISGDSSVSSGYAGIVAWKFIPPTSEGTTFGLYKTPSISTTESVSFDESEVIDLTQYFNGDTTLINSIQTWDDLVAYDPRFASYVEYNTGTVVGVQPTVKVNRIVNIWNTSGTTNNESVGITWTKNNDNSMTINGQKTSGQYQSMSNGGFVTQAEVENTFSHKFCLCGVPTDVTVSFYAANRSNHAVFTGSDVFSLSYMPGYPRFRVISSTTFDNVKFFPKIFDLTAMFGAGNEPSTFDDFNAIMTSWGVNVDNDNIAYGETVLGGTVQAPAPLFAVGNAADEYEAVSGVTTRKIGSYTFTGNETVALSNWAPLEGTYAVCLSRTNFPNIGYGTGNTVRTIGADLPGVTYSGSGTSVAGNVGTALYTSNTSYGLFVRVPISVATDNATLLTWLTGKTIYYELATPTTSSSTPTQISLQAGNNVAMQTDGGRTAGYTLDYDGTDYTVALQTSRKYAFNDNGVKSVITNVSSQATVIGEDELVDLTQLVNGDTIKLEAITSWDDLATQYPEYNSHVAYNTGEVVGITPTVKVTGKNLLDGTVYACRVSSSRPWLTDDTNAVTSPYVKEATSDNRGVAVKCLVNPLQTYTVSSNMAGYSLMTVGFYKNEMDCTNSSLCLSYISSNSFTVPAGAHWVVIAWATRSEGSITWSKIQLELGSSATAYEPYHDGGTMTASAPLFGIGTARDSEEGIGGQRTQTLKSVDLSTLTWTESAGVYTATVADIKPNTANVMTANGYTVTVSGTSVSVTASASPTGIMLYELNSAAVSSVIPSQITLQAGTNTLLQTDGGRTADFTLDYDGTDYTIATKSTRVYLKDVNGTVERVTGVSSIDVRGGQDNVIDLTRMFGASLEPGTLDAFYSLFPAWRGYKLPYNEGSLLNFKGTGLKSVGFNQFNGEYSEEGKYLTSTGTLTADTNFNVTDYLRAVPGQTYRLTAYGNAPSICWYTYDKTLISGTAYGHASTWQEDVFTAPANAYWVRFSVYMPREAETCFYFQWSGPRNGDYEPYWDYTRPIPTLTYFPDGMNGRGDVYDEINDRQAIRRFGVVDLGTLEWSHNNNGTWSTSLSGMNSGAPVVIPSAGYDITVSGTTLTVTSDDSPAGSLTYELATPVVTNFDDEVNMTARISDFGTEECLPVNGYVPVTAPFRGMVLYQDDYARTITKLPENYQSQSSMDNLLALLGSLHNGTITSTFDSANQVYTYQFTPNE